jgi:aminoacrylate hydrolase
VSFIEVPGARIAYERIGQGPAVLLIQGVGVAGSGWRPQVSGLSNHYTLITFDNRGIGQSTGGSAPFTIATLAADALAILDAEHIAHAHLVGHSMGGVIAQALALAAPERVDSLTFMCTFARGAQATALTPALLWLGMRTRIGTAEMRRQAFLELVLPVAALAGRDRPTLAAELAELFGHDLAYTPPIVMKQLRATRQFDQLARLSTLSSVPTLVIAASEDRIARLPFGRMLAAAIPGAQLVEVANAGHGLPIQRAREVNEMLVAHWARAAQIKHDAARPA